MREGERTMSITLEAITSKVPASRPIYNLKGERNAVVPQIPQLIGEAILRSL